MLKTSLIIFFVTLCAILFLQNSWQNVGKFISGASMVTRSVKSDQDKLPFPPLSICMNPPYNERAISENSIDVDSWNYISLSKRDQNQSIDFSDWNKLVFSAEDVFDFDFVLEEGAFNPKNSDGTWYLGTHLDQIKIEAIDTFFDGRCFTITPDIKKTPHDPIIIALKYPWYEYSPRNKFKFFIHNEEERVNLIGQYWMARRPNLQNIDPRTIIDFVIYTQERKALTHDNSGKVKCSEDGWSTYFTCYKNIVKTHVTEQCALPFTPLEDSKPDQNCTTEIEMKEYQSAYLKSMHEIQKECLNPCHTQTYDIQARPMHNGNGTSNLTAIWYMHGSHEIDVFTEVRLYDTDAIIASVGGSLGLFLGFSVLETILISINSLFKYLQSSQESHQKQVQKECAELTKRMSTISMNIKPQNPDLGISQ